MSTDGTLLGGLMSGTSLDGVDALLLEVRGSDPASIEWGVRGFLTEPFSPEERDRIAEVIATGGVRDIAFLGRDLGRKFAGAFRNLLSESGVSPTEVAAVGSHGQTVWHEPPDAGGRGVTLQIGDPATLAEELGCAVVSDFRTRDLAAGGQGAPLVPWCDWVLLRRPGKGRALQNLGGMGNVTFLPGAGGPEGVIGFDTGPGVALLNGAARLASGGEDPWDVDGRRATRGTVLPDVLDELMRDPFLRTPPPRSTGRERFGDERVGQIVARTGPARQDEWDDLLATLAAFTVNSVVAAYRDFLPAGAVEEVVLTGGGAKNPSLVSGLASALAPIPVRTGATALGMDPDAREAAAFALLAWAHLRGIPANLPQVTGARGPRVLGSFTPGPTRPKADTPRANTPKAGTPKVGTRRTDP
ncbi:MAG: anhydro-N-acetylmuramic acid kinase [Gemmatimonadetes bacterium]|nr:anhydro-N-acetylmuramic acid kinase [Gemmatimonadota bacterium]